MPTGIATLLRITVLGSLGMAAIIYAGIIVIACIKLGTIHEVPTLAKVALPWFYGIYFVLLAGFSVYLIVILLMAKRNLKGKRLPMAVLTATMI